MTELLPCPFCPCGGTPRHIEAFVGEREDWILCEKCKGSSGMMPTKEQAIELWNTRASPWIRTSQRLPSHEDMVHFICYGDLDMPNKIIDYGSYAESIGNESIACFVSWITGYAHEVKNVTYWMPAPELPGDE
jgi:hypothetical protein